jgi:hypothetical protein
MKHFTISLEGVEEKILWENEEWQEDFFMKVVDWASLGISMPLFNPHLNPLLPRYSRGLNQEIESRVIGSQMRGGTKLRPRKFGLYFC